MHMTVTLVRLGDQRFFIASRDVPLTCYRERGGLMTGMTLDATDAAELPEMLQFLADWLQRDPTAPRVAGRLRRHPA